jgi:TetR/AcrR family transcriptional repressor of mexJK operon
MAAGDDGEVLGRSAHKHRAILDAARTVFLQKGYLGTSMDEIAALAKVSKQTVYKHFADKEGLFGEVIELTMAGVNRMIRDEALSLTESTDPTKDLEDFARQLLRSLTRPDVLRLRRLVIGEAERFPTLGKAYWDQAFALGIDRLASGIESMSKRGLLTVEDPWLAAAQFAGMVLWVPANRALFGVGELSREEVDRHTAEGVRTFLRAYGA